MRRALLSSLSCGVLLLGSSTQAQKTLNVEDLGTPFLLVHLSPQPREFAGLFVDDVRVTLTHRPPRP